MMIDQDVALTEATRHTSLEVQRELKMNFETSGKEIAAYGVGYPTRGTPPNHFGLRTFDEAAEAEKPSETDFNSPAQQFVAIKAPFRQNGKDGKDGIYEPYMVGGGEDMLMGIRLGLIKEGKNISLLDRKIVKKALEGPADQPNSYWNEMHRATLEELFKAEKDTLVEFDGEKMSLEDLILKFEDRDLIERRPSMESYNTAACIIERIILRYHKDNKEKGLPFDEHNTIFNTHHKMGE
ncbi:Putative uncharacterized protein [Mycoavidus cysteinexigens]|uniref:Uncharacterized protein n=2 Tax=Mycoavidus cysteinexigens TaxID=1553431 RepID=A0A2Z6ETL2_9BURK|nr:Putative uncharacterized protein [Mycoavidus cysteinexigens]GLR01562.1 hypothetical protein GCM10007934_13740 [Mycoavidus cysteinexigens]